MVTDIEKRALQFATRAHEGQTRKYDGRPYIVHPIAVADLVRSVPHSTEMIAAALLHDTVEDTSVTLLDIKDNFGSTVANLVAWLTDVSTPFHGNRATRKALDCLHLSMAPAEAKTIKLADLIENTSSIRYADPSFWKVYGPEKLRLLEVLVDGDQTLWQRAASAFDD